jgi:hypothetical protein
MPRRTSSSSPGAQRFPRLGGPAPLLWPNSPPPTVKIEISSYPPSIVGVAMVEPFGRALRELRRGADLTQRQLAEKTKLDFSMLRSIGPLKGRR